jgi:hypothetical protein
MDESHGTARRYVRGLHSELVRRLSLTGSETALEVGHRLVHRALGRPAHEESVEEAAPSRSRLVLDRDSVREHVVDLVEVAPVAYGRQAALLACVLDKTVGLESHEPHVELYFAAEDPEDKRGAVTGLAPAHRRRDPLKARPVFRPIVRIGDVVETVADSDWETAFRLDANRIGHSTAR